MSKGTKEATLTLVVMITLIAIPATIAGGTLALLKTIGEEECEVKVHIQGSVEWGRPAPNTIILTHKGGDRIKDAFFLYDGKIVWGALSVKINDAFAQVRGGATLNGRDSVGFADFVEGDQLVIPVMHEFIEGDRITLLGPGGLIGTHIIGSY